MTLVGVKWCHPGSAQTTTLPSEPTPVGDERVIGTDGSAEHAKPRTPIEDNSFLVEEAYNQETAVIQHISMFTRSQSEGSWVCSLPHEWPVGSQRHQLSYTLTSQRAVIADSDNTGFGDAAINYRYQLAYGGTLWVAPRLSVLLPTGNARKGLGSGGTGLQFNLQASWQASDRWVSHSNVGFTYAASAGDASGDRADTRAVSLGQSVTFLAWPLFNVMLEAVWSSYETVVGPGRTRRDSSACLSPGVRWAYNFSSGLRIVPGIGLPIGVGTSRGQRAVIAYLSFEHPLDGLR